MSLDAGERDRRLQRLQRWRELELEQARVERARADEATDRQRGRVSDMRREMGETQELERARVTAEAGVSVEFLRCTRTFARWQMKQVGEQETALKVSERLADEARLEVGRRYERVAVIERLRERGVREAAIGQGRAQQRSLDDQALVRGRINLEQGRQRAAGDGHDGQCHRGRSNDG